MEPNSSLVYPEMVRDASGDHGADTSQKELFDRNAGWSKEMWKKDPNVWNLKTRLSLTNDQFFPRHVPGQRPEILWIGCADARVPETTIMGCQPGDIFVHRNIAK